VHRSFQTVSLGTSVNKGKTNPERLAGRNAPAIPSPGRCAPEASVATPPRRERLPRFQPSQAFRPASRFSPGFVEVFSA
jgi:hypothetical protein